MDESVCQRKENKTFISLQDSCILYGLAVVFISQYGFAQKYCSDNRIICAQMSYLSNENGFFTFFRFRLKPNFRIKDSHWIFTF